MISDKDFYTLWGEALASFDRDMYVSEWSTSSVWPEGGDLLEIADKLGSIWDAAHMSVREIVASTELTQAAFATRYCIPRRTVEDWCRGISKCPDYIRLMLIRLLGILDA